MRNTYQCKGLVNVLLREVVVDHVKEANGLASIKDFLGDLLGVGLEVGKVNDRDRFNNHCDVGLCVQIVRRKRKKSMP